MVERWEKRGALLRKPAKRLRNEAGASVVDAVTLIMVDGVFGWVPVPPGRAAGGATGEEVGGSGCGCQYLLSNFVRDLHGVDIERLALLFPET